MSEKSDFQEHLEGWFTGRLPSEWFAGPVEVTFDRDEILAVGTLAEPELPTDAGPETRTAAIEARISGFREDTRGQRMRIADEAERGFGPQERERPCRPPVHGSGGIGLPSSARARVTDRGARRGGEPRERRHGERHDVETPAGRALRRAGLFDPTDADRLPTVGDDHRLDCHVLRSGCVRRLGETGDPL